MQPISPRFGYKDVMGGHGESLDKAKESDIHCPPHPCRAGHLFHQEGRQAGQAHLVPGEPILAIPSHCPVLHDVDTDPQDLLRNFPRHWIESDQLVLPQIPLPAFFF